MEQKELMRIIDRAVIHLAHSYKFGCFEIEDMMQEGRMEALKAIPKYDDSKNCSLEHFIRVHVRNRFKNLKRKHMERLEPPCTYCECETECPENCSKRNAWLERNTAKRALMESFDSDDVRTQENLAEFPPPTENLMINELQLLMDTHLPFPLRADYRRYLEGVRLPKQRREIIEQEIHRIAQQHYFKGESDGKK
jgi:RNA polymerase sigma factor (sigma-70 family)